MKNLQIRPQNLFISNVIYTFLLALPLISFSSLAVAQTSPQRGLYPTGTFQLSDVDIIDTTSGNLAVRFPLGSLPPGRGDVRAGFTLYYNSKLFDSYRGGGTNNRGESYSADLLVSSPQGGWQYGYEYKLQVHLRPNIGDYPPCSAEQQDRFRVVVTYPDGNNHEFHPWGYRSINSDGYYSIQPNGWDIAGCRGQGSHVTNSMTYYSTDGTYTRLEVDASNPTGDYSLLPWTMFLPDGGKITHLEPLPGGGVAYQRIYDRNNNWVEIKNVTLNGHPAIKIVDELNREVALEYGGGGGGIDTITSPAPNNQTVEWKVVRTSVDPVGGYNTPGSDGDTYSYDFPSSPGVSSIISPAQAGAREYQFTYNINNGSGGELKDIILPTPGLTAKISYTFRYENTCPGCIPNASDALKSYVSQKQKSYVEEYDGATSPPVIETSTYTRSGNINGLQSEVDTQAPDSGVTKEYSFCSSSGPCGPYNLQWRAGLVYKIEHPDGSLTERLWQTNSPQNPYEAVFVNSYIKTEFTSIKEGSVLSKTAIKDYNYDKNGNVTRIVEYDWVPYSSIPRDADGRPTGIPGSASSQIKRVTANTYHVTTPDASDVTTANANVYNLITAPKLRTAVKDKEVRSALASGTQSRSEYSYDNSLTTGNLTTERSWDSIKGVISAPLDASNSISVTHQYQTWPSGATGKLTATTDANGNTTNYFYEDIGNGTTDLYVTKIETAANAAALKQTTTSKYDYNSGLVTETKDVDNNVSTLTTYDFYGRPTLVREAANTLAERQTATEYSDFDRRVIVRADLNTTGDGKLITIQHYDSWGRVCLTRSLESGDPTEATDKTKGVKIQTRYFAGDAGNPNGYELVSAPYRAATSGEAGGEPGMAWNRTKFDRLGRIIEVETFAGAEPPAPWGGSAASSGRATTEYDAEFTTVTDQAGVTRRSQTDALGRLMKVTEDHSASNYDTFYSYDALGNLRQVTQGGQTRTFAYNSLSRLTSAANPESGPFSYSYDPDGNLIQKTDARGVTTTMGYDALNRVTSKTYSGGTPDATTIANATPPVHYYYDDYSTLPSGAPSYAGTPSKGRLIGVIYGSGTEGTYYKYDAEGKIIISCKRAGTSNYQTGYKYNLAGGVTDEVRSDRRKNTYYYDQAGRLTGYQTSNYPYLAFTNVVSNIQYTAFGAIQQETYGNSLLHSLDYNARSQPMRIWLGQLGNPGAVMRMDYIFGLAEEVNVDDQSILQQYNNGNVGRINYYINGALQRSQTFQYDGLNRLKYAVEHTNGDHSDAARAWYQTLQYDRFGNRGIDVANSSGNASGSGGALQLSEFDAANNRITRSGYTYDAAGNLTAEPGKSYAYDAENRMITAAAQGVTTIQCMYDGNGRRVKKIVNGFGTGFEYGAGGELLTERDDSGNIIKDYLYRNGELIATAETGGTVYKYATSDHLGSPRVWTDSNGNVVAGGRHDYLPFGDELFAGNGTRAAEQGYASHTQQDGQRKQFGSKERDIETGLDYFLARYYSSAQGRFTSPDEFAGGPVELFTFADAASANPTFYADLTNPQSLNKYQYTYNNPLSYTDSDGHCPECPAYWLNSKIQEIDRKITQIKTDLVDYGKGLGKSVANAAIDTVNFGNVSMLDDGRLHYNYKRYEPSNEVQAMGMNSGDKLMLLSIGLGKPLPVNVAMAEAEGAVVSTELINKADIIREAGLHPASRNQRTIAVGEDAAGGLHAGSSNGFDRGQRAAAEKLGVRCVRCKGDNHAEENLLREVPDLRKVGTSKRSPCGPGEHNCRGQLEQRGVKIENDR